MSVDTLWFTRCPNPSPASIAIRNGWLVEEFAPDGIEVLSLAASKDKDVHQSHSRHTHPNFFRFGGYVPPLVSRSRGADARIVGLGWPDRTAEIVVAPGSDIAGGADLKGRRLGVPVRVNDSVDWWQATVRAGYEDALVSDGSVLVLRQRVPTTLPGLAAVVWLGCAEPTTVAELARAATDVLGEHPDAEGIVLDTVRVLAEAGAVAIR